MVDLPLEDLPYIWQVHLNTVFIFVGLGVHVLELSRGPQLFHSWKE